MARETEEQLRGLVDSIRDYGILMLNPDGLLIDWNRGAESALGYSREEIAGSPYETLFVREDIAKGKPARELAEAANSGRSAGERWMLRKDGLRFWGNAVTTAIRDAEGKLTGFASVVRPSDNPPPLGEALAAIKMPVVARRTLLGEIVTELHGVCHDPLTGLANRNLLDDRIGQAIERTKRTSNRVGVFLIDVDSIRKINETLGASAGNEVLVTLATRLKTSVRAADSVLRIGDDEFAVVMGEICLPRDLHYCAGKILQPLLHPIPAIGRSIEVDCSMGVSVYPDCASSVEELVVRADAAKQSAKQRGKNEVEFFISSPARPVNSPRAAPILSVPAATLANEQGAAPSPVEVAME